MIVRYIVLSPSGEARRCLIGELFGTFEISPQGGGEKARLVSDDGELEVVGVGVQEGLRPLARRILRSRVQVDGVLVLLPSGDEASWQDAVELTRWAGSEFRNIPVRTWVFDRHSGMNKDVGRKAMLTLMKDHEEVLESG